MKSNPIRYPVFFDMLQLVGVSAGRSGGCRAGRLAVALLLAPLWAQSAGGAEPGEDPENIRADLRERGRVIAQTLSPLLEQFNSRSIAAIESRLTGFNDGKLRIKLLFRPAGMSGSDNLFYIASIPAVPKSELMEARAELLGTGILDNLHASCLMPVGTTVVRHVSPADQRMVLSTVIPISTATGCWALITSRLSARLPEPAAGRPTWTNPKTHILAAFYLLTAAILCSALFLVWRNQAQVVEWARGAHGPGSPSRQLVGAGGLAARDSLAESFAPLTELLRSSRHAYEARGAGGGPTADGGRWSFAQFGVGLGSGFDAGDNAEPWFRPGFGTGHAAPPPRSSDPLEQSINLSTLLQDVLGDYAKPLERRQIHLTLRIEDDVVVKASLGPLKMVFENILDNAASFSPTAGEVTVMLARRGESAEVIVDDEGPGVEPTLLGRIFDRNFTKRLDGPSGGVRPHTGIGLWLVRRYVETVGGSVRAENRIDRGLRIRVALPVAA